MTGPCVNWFTQGPVIFVLAPHSIMPAWSPEIVKAVQSDVRFALTFKVGRSRRPLTEIERDMVAAAIVEHLQLANWKIERGPPPPAAEAAEMPPSVEG